MRGDQNSLLKTFFFHLKWSKIFEIRSVDKGQLIPTI